MSRKVREIRIYSRPRQENLLFPKRQTGFVAHSAYCLLRTGVLSRRVPEANVLLHLVPDSKIRVATPELMIN